MFIFMLMLNPICMFLVEALVMRVVAPMIMLVSVGANANPTVRPALVTNLCAD